MSPGPRRSRFCPVIYVITPDPGWMLPGWARTLWPVRTSVAGVLLAAGEGSRFGRPKALVELEGQTLAERGVDLLRAGGAAPVLVVTGAAPVELGGIPTIYNPQ